MPGGWLMSKPTCWKTLGCFSTSAFFVLVSRDCCNDQGTTLDNHKGRLIMYIGGGLLTLVVIILLVVFFMRH